MTRPASESLSCLASELTVKAAKVSDLSRIQDHLLRLSADDRSRRFSAGVVADDTIRAYVSRMRVGHDLVFCLLDREHSVVGLAHGCAYQARGSAHVEVAFSVDAAWRGRGWGTRLMQAVQEQARSAGVQHVLGLCSVRNLPMRRIFERADMQLTREEDEMHAHRELPGLALAA